MKYLLILDLTLTALGAAMGVAVGFVALVYALYRHESAKMEAGVAGVFAITACFAALFLLAGSASLLLRRGLRWHWAAQALLIAAMPLLWHIVYFNLQTP